MQQPTQPPLQQAVPTAAIWDLGAELISDPLSVSGSSEALAAFNAAFTTMQQAKNAGTIKLLGIDNQVETNWRFSSVLVCMSDPTNGNIAFLPMIVEASRREEIMARAVRVGNSDRTVTVTPMPSDGVDAAYVARMKELVKEAYGGDFSNIDESKIRYVPGLLLPAKHFNFLQTERCQEVLARATKSCRDVLIESRAKRLSLNVKNLKGGGVVQVRPTSGRGDLIDTVGLPVRSDFEVILASAPQQQDQTQNMSAVQAAFTINSPEQSESRFGRMSAYTDFRMLPPQHPYGNNFDPRILTRRFVPEAVITSTEMNKISTTGALALLVSQAVCLADPRVNRGLLFTRQQQSAMHYKNSPFNPTNLGVLNHYAGYATPVGANPDAYDLLSATVTPREFVDYVDNVIDPNIAISIDVPRLGTQAAYLNVLAGCAQGNPEALRQFKIALQELTDGKFATKFFGPGNESMELKTEHVFSECNNSVFNGVFGWKLDGETRDLDLRHIDLNAVIARFATSDKDMITRFVQSFMVQQMDPLVRMAQRREVIEAYTNGSAEFYGISDRNTFSVALLQTIALCNADNGFKPTLQYQDPLAAADTGLHAPAFMQGGLWNGGVNAFSNMTQGAAAAGGAYYNPTPNRF